jgi:UDP-glucose 4-epimerase
VDEDHPKRATSEYNLSKLIGEQLTELAAQRTGLRTVIVRPSHVLSGEKILAQFTVARVVANLKSGERNPQSELFAGAGADLWKQVEAQADSPDQPCSVTDLEGRPWYYQPNDARDVAHALVCALERPEALGESFNLGAPEPFLVPQGARLLADLSRQRLLEVQLPVRWRYDHAIGKAKGWIGYAPQGDLETMLRDAWDVKQGTFQDYDWRHSR